MKKWIGWLCAAVLVMTVSTALASGTEIFIQEGTMEFSAIDVGISNDEALEGFVNRAFGIGEALPQPGKKQLLKAPLGSRLTGQNAQVYAFLHDCICEVAAGRRSSTVFRMPVTDLLDQLSYTAEELGVAAIIVDGKIDSDAVNAMYGKFEYDITLIMDRLMADCPYELYWFDKSKTGGYTRGYPGVGARSDSSGERIYFAEDAALYFDMKVAKEYAVSNAYGTTDFDTAIANTIMTAAQHAAEIVSAHSGESDYGKLKAYKNTICELVSYNRDAADDETETPYGNPWQLIWVFDGDESTNVVCEGYSKAFKYLCDQSSFDSSVSAAIATGLMEGGTGAGPHMWNLVTMNDGLSYLVDVTNCDSGTVGEPDYLFMAGYTAREENTFAYLGANETIISYTYDDDTIRLYADEELEISSEAFQPQPESVCGDSLTWRMDGSTLIISGSGDMFDYGETQAPWAEIGIEAAVLEDGVTSIGSNAFAMCEALSSVTMPGSMKRVGDFAFTGCSSLTEIELAAGIETLGDGAFCNSGLTEIRLPAGTAARTWYFYEPDANFSAPRLYSVDLPLGITDADQHAPFLGAPLASLSPDFVTPASLTSIESEAFANTEPAFVWLTDGVSSIGDGAFADCPGLRFVRIPSSCRDIGENVFPADTVLLVEWGDEAYEYAIEHQYDYILYAEGFNG